VKFLITLNMPAFENSLVHQITLELEEINSLAEFCTLMNREEFIIGKHWYRHKNLYNNKHDWQDRGDIILNTAHIGKVVEYLDLDALHDNSQREVTVVRTGQQGLRRPLRP